MKFNIEGFEDMSAEEKLAAIEAYDPEANGYVPKATLDKTASQTADFKRRAKEAEAATASANEYSKTLEARIADLEKREEINGLTAKYLGLGYSAELAKSSAKAFVEHDADTLFANQQKFLADAQKVARANALDGMQQPASGRQGANPVDYDALIAAAQQAGEYSQVAYYTRLKGESEQTK